MRAASAALWRIPARAGKTSWMASEKLRPVAHPRACGENARNDAGAAHILGSSPRARGKRLQAVVGGHGAGLIPARAGKTPTSWRRISSGSAHPRVCGENELPLELADFQRDSSPRVRGKLLRLLRA